MIHILFGDSPAGGLKVALTEMGVCKKESVISFWDLFSIAPVWRLHEEIGKKERFNWMKNVINDDEDFQEYKQRFFKTVHQIVSIPDEVPITIWIAENSHEQTGLRFVLHLLRDKTNEIYVINTTMSYADRFNRPDTKYVVLHTGEISPEKLRVIYEQSQSNLPLSQDEREKLQQEWLALAENRETLRIWQDGRIVSVPEDYYDPFIIQKAKYLHSKPNLKGFIKSARLIGEVLGQLEQHVGDSFLEYRLRKLIEKKIFEVEGSLKAMRYYSVTLSQKR